MRCKDIEHLIIESSERKLIKQEQLTIDQHVLHCASCKSFMEELEKIHCSIEAVPLPSLSNKLESETREMCHAEIRAQQEMALAQIRQTRFTTIPKYIWAALFTLIILTLILFVPSIKDFKLGESLSFEIAVILMIIIQNGIMLFFAPILFRKFRSSNKGFKLVLK